MNSILQAKIERGAKLARDIAALERKKAELDSLKKEFRELAGPKDLDLVTPSGARVTIEHKGPATARVVADNLLGKVQRLCLADLFALFTLHPSKGSETNFALNAHKTLKKSAAESLIELLTVKATAWVKFS